jgi:hypothetical protein
MALTVGTFGNVWAKDGFCVPNGVLVSLVRRVSFFGIFWIFFVFTVGYGNRAGVVFSCSCFGLFFAGRQASRCGAAAASLAFQQKKPILWIRAASWAITVHVNEVLGAL